MLLHGLPAVTEAEQLLVVVLTARAQGLGEVVDLPGEDGDGSVHRVHPARLAASHETCLEPETHSFNRLKIIKNHQKSFISR